MNAYGEPAVALTAQAMRDAIERMRSQPSRPPQVVISPRLADEVNRVLDKPVGTVLTLAEFNRAVGALLDNMTPEQRAQAAAETLKIHAEMGGW